MYYVFSCSVLLTSFSLLQIGTQNSLEILEDPKAEVVDEIAAKLGLRKVRMLSDLMRLWQWRKSLAVLFSFMGLFKTVWAHLKSSLSVSSSYAFRYEKTKWEHFPEHKHLAGLCSWSQQSSVMNDIKGSSKEAETQFSLYFSANRSRSW